MKKIILLSAFAFCSKVALCTTAIITNSGFTFSPNSVSINSGDSVNFQIASMHEVVEVSQSTWNANGNTPIAIGFSTPFGGGLILPAQLTVGTHYYVCVPHASLGMKGIIIVNSTVGISEIANTTSLDLNIYPNPNNGRFVIHNQDAKNTTGNMNIEIYNMIGEQIYRSTVQQLSNLTFDIANKPNGIYFLTISSAKGREIRKVIKN